VLVLRPNFITKDVAADDELERRRMSEPGQTANPLIWNKIGLQSRQNRIWRARIP
jgi:hypothetical protein